jgi:hypothetical protein
MMLVGGWKGTNLLKAVALKFDPPPGSASAKAQVGKATAGDS